MHQDGKEEEEEEEEEGKNNNGNSFQFRDLHLFRLHFVAGVPALGYTFPSEWVFLLISSSSSSSSSFFFSFAPGASNFLFAQTHLHLLPFPTNEGKSNTYCASPPFQLKLRGKFGAKKETTISGYWSDVTLISLYRTKESCQPLGTKKCPIFSEKMPQM